MPVILAIETSAHVGGVALLPDAAAPNADAVIGEVIRDEHKLSAWLLPAIDRVLARWGGDSGQIDAIAFGAGPGSFTGVRTACATAQALAYAWQKPLLAVDSLQALAHQAVDDGGNDTTHITVALDARMGEVYTASFVGIATGSGVELRRQTATTVQRPAAVTLTAGTLLLGSGASLVHAAQPEGLATAVDAEHNCNAESGWAIGVGRAAATMLSSDAKTDPLTAEPVYVRNNVAQTEAERLALRQTNAVLVA